MSDPLSELGKYLVPSTRIDVIDTALSYVLSLSGTDEGVKTICENEEIVLKVVELTSSKAESIAKEALLTLVNLSASPHGAKLLLKVQSQQYADILKLLVEYVLNPEKKDAEACCMILCNMTRPEEVLETCVSSLFPHLNDLLNAFVNLDFNKKGSKLHYIAPLFSNLGRSEKIRKWLAEENPHIPLLKILPFCDYKESEIRRGGAVGTVKNLCFSIELHEWLLNPEIDLLYYTLGPLMGNEDYDDEEMDNLPVSLQYLPKEKEREPDVDIRKMLLETLNRLCTKKTCRETLRNFGVYYALREYHKWEKDRTALLACENVVDILIRKEEEIGLEDITSVDVPAEWTDKFEKMDDDFVKDV